MREQNYSFFGADIVAMGSINRNAPLRSFDWDKAAAIIKERLKDNPFLVAEAGLQGDWSYTGGCIFRDGKPVSDDYTYLSSTWATPMLLIDDEEFECWSMAEGTRFDSDTKWDDESLAILNHNQKQLES